MGVGYGGFFSPSSRLIYSPEKGWWSGEVEVEEEWGVWYSFFLQCLEGFHFYFIPLERNLGCEGPSNGIFFHLDSSLGEDPCEKLMKWVYSLVSRYCMCQCSGETIEHLLIHCTMAYELWSFVFYPSGFIGF